MLILSVFSKIFLILLLIFFGVFSYVCLMWTNRNKKVSRNILGAVAVSLIYSFQIAIVGSLLAILFYFFYPLLKINW